MGAHQPRRKSPTRLQGEGTCVGAKGADRSNWPAGPLGKVEVAASQPNCKLASPRLAFGASSGNRDPRTVKNYSRFLLLPLPLATALRPTKCPFRSFPSREEGKESGMCC